MPRNIATASIGRIALDLIVAYAAVGIFGALTFLLYQPLRESSLTQNIIAPAIVTGRNTALLQSHGRCVGDIATSLSEEDAPALETVVRVQSAFAGESLLTTGTLRAQFNPLHQLGRGTLTVESPRFSLLVTATDVTPIRLSITARLGATSRTFDTTIPGPISLVRNGGNSYRLEYPYIPPVVGSTSTRTFLTDLAKEIDLVVTQPSTAPTACAMTKTDTLNLAPLITRFGPMVKPLLGREVL